MKKLTAIGITMAISLCFASTAFAGEKDCEKQRQECIKNADRYWDFAEKQGRGHDMSDGRKADHDRCEKEAKECRKERGGR